jgi:Domain of unknown function (DUF4190)
MKRCPSCDKTFDEEWLSFCTQDGTTLVEEAASADLIDTIMARRPPDVSKHDQQAIWNLPAAELDPSLGRSSPKQEAVEPVWQPPPPPLYARPQNKSLATASMIVGIASICCLGPIPAIVAIILGAVALSQMKKDPERVGGRQAALTGIITGGLAVILYGGLMIIYIIAIIYGLNS